MRADLIEPNKNTQQVTTQIADRRSDGVYCWHKVKMPVPPTFTQPQASWPDSQSASREEYERELKVRQAEHLRNIAKNKAPKWVPCLHDVCPHCLGTGQKIDGSPCVHNLDCTCPKCENVRMAP